MDGNLETQDEVQEESVNTEVVEESQVSMEDTIRNTLSSIQERGEDTGIEDDRPRDERGRFAKQQEAEQQQPEQQQAQQPQERGDDVPPSSLSGQVKQAWTNLPPEIRKEFVKRENDFHKGIGQYKQAAEFGAQMYKTLEPYIPTMRQLNTTPDRVVAVMLKSDHILRNGSMQEKRELLGNIIQQYGITFSDEPQQQRFDPRQLATQIQSQIPQIVDQTLTERMEKIEVERAKQEVEAFASASDKFGLMNDWQVGPDGSSFSPFRQLMVSAIQSGLASDLSTAYEVAARAHPKSYEQLVAQQQSKQEEERKKAEQERLKQSAQRVSQARHAGVPNVKARGTLPQTPSAGTMEDTIRNKLREIRG